MKLMMLIGGILMAAVMAVFLHAPVRAELTPAVRIMLVQAAGSDAKFERVDIQNLSSETVDVTGWKLVYKSASGSTTTTLLQLVSEPGWHVLLDAGSRETFISKELVAATLQSGALEQTTQFNAGMNHLGGGLQLTDGGGVIVDALGWGTASETVRQGSSAPAMTGATWLVRHSVTGDNGGDFLLESQNTVSYAVIVGSLYDVYDVCGNIAEIQTEVPTGHYVNERVCLPVDVCENLEGVQTELPEGMEYGDSGVCQPIDLCGNLEGVQSIMPQGYELTEERVCESILPLRLLLITEVLPNPSGSDEGSEFIELYNADTEPIALNNYRLQVGEKTYPFAADTVIQPSGYLTFSDSDLDIAFPNTTGLQMWLITNRNVEVASAPAYTNAKDDVSWALIDGIWQYTYTPTPGEANVALAALPCEVGYVSDDETSRCRKIDIIAASSAPCRDGQYRHEETNRCRTIPAPTVLAPCKEGQYRSEETNRCRSLVALLSSASKPCADDQFRNPLTNRCKSIASHEDAALTDCGEGRERNPTTNRCRNTVSASTSTVAFPVEPVKDTVEAFVGWWALGGVGVLAIGYAGWEWRREVGGLVDRARSFFLTK